MFRMQQRITEVTREKSLGKKESLSSYCDFSGPAPTPMTIELIGVGGFLIFIGPRSDHSLPMSVTH